MNNLILGISTLALPILGLIGMVGLSNAAVNSTDGSFNHNQIVGEIQETRRTPSTPIEAEKRDRVPTERRGTETGNPE